VTAAAFAAAIARGALPVDTRTLPAFAAGHVPGAVPLEFNLADLAERAALLLPPGLPAVVHAEPPSSAEAAAGLLGDAGLDVLGQLEGGLGAWREAGLPVETLEVEDVARLFARGDGRAVLDVRERYEYRHGHVPGARHLPAGEVWGAPAARLAALAAGRPLSVFCSGQGRAAFAAAVLLRRGIPARLVWGGMYEWERAGYPVERGDGAGDGAHAGG
jgi:hydroxyacylglutathione hydrolase